MTLRHHLEQTGYGWCPAVMPARFLLPPLILQALGCCCLPGAGTPWSLGTQQSHVCGFFSHLPPAIAAHWSPLWCLCSFQAPVLLGILWKQVFQVVVPAAFRASPHLAATDGTELAGLVHARGWHSHLPGPLQGLGGLRSPLCLSLAVICLR